MKNMKVSAKLFVSFLIIAALAGAVGLTGIIGMRSMLKVNKQMYDINIVAIAAMADVRELYQRERNDIRALFLSKDDPATVQSLISDLKSYNAIVTECFAIYEETITDPEEETAYYTARDAYLLQFIPMKDRLYEMIAAGEFDQAYSFFLTYADVVGTITNGLTEGAALNDKLALESYADSESTFNRSWLLEIAVIAFAVAASVALAMYISGLISKPLSRLTELSGRLAVGDTDLRFDKLNRSDEIGKLCDAFAQVINALHEMSADATMLVDAAENGLLSTRADTSKHQGDFKRIIEGVNHTLDLVTEPVRNASEVLAKMARGDLNVSVEGDFRGDHAAIKNAVNETITNIRAYIGEISEKVGAIAEGNFNVEITSDFKGDFVVLKEAINCIAESLSEVMLGINTAAEQVLSGTQQVSDGAQNVSQGATEQASSIEELTATVSQIADQTRQNALNANENSRQAMTIKQFAEEGNERMRALQAAMTEINAASANISKIVKEIDNIAFQTNILALNAAVEAAHAGSYGQGFAVVAEEVRSLADKSAAAAKDTTALIEDSIRKSEIGAQIANETAQSLEKIVEGVTGATEVIGQIAEASNEQASGIAQVNKGLEQMSQVVQTNSATAQESAASAQELSGQADMLKQMVGRFVLKGQSGVAMRQPPQPARRIPANTSAHRPGGRLSIVLNDSEFGKY